MADFDELLDLGQLTEEERDRLERRMISGRQADQVLGSEVFKLAFVARRMTLMRQWQESKPEESALRERLYLQFQELQSIEARLTNQRSEGQRAERRLTDADS